MVVSTIAVDRLESLVL